ncbi:uncharacterized protein LOC135468748 isoform X2 [Liolophura sinensis]|uniref:uncharacterized protein LOC135468748 isoform X2 n=1 Tax=Liolophura sinensis TaxID=3198878 RepID=UPI00315933E7
MRRISRRHARMTKLIWWFRVLRAVCGLAQDMKRLSMTVTENTTVSQVYVYNACGYSGMLDGDQTLFFDKSQFSRRKTMLFPVWAQKLAMLGPESRTEEDVRQIRGLMLMMKSFREKYTEVMQYKMAKVAMYINCEKGRVILRQGHWGINFYFIYSGSVFVQKETVDPKTKEKKIQTQNIIRAGESFGEIAILGDGKRTASIICREPTEVFQVDKGTFLETCPEVFEVELDAKMAFVEQFEMFLGWDEENLRRMCFLSQAIYIPHGKIIEADWSKTSYAYFVMQGRISLMRKFDISDLKDTGAVHVSGMMDKPLHLPNPQEDKYGGIRTERYANVGELHVGDHCDLRVLLNDSEMSVDTLSMVSQGAKVLRVEHRIIRWLGPMNTIEEYLRKRYIPFRIPEDVQLCQRYVEECNWDVFKRKTMAQISCDRHKKEVAMMPVTCKGQSGWARWPGSGVYRESGTAFHSPIDRRDQLAEFLTHVRSKQKPTETTRHKTRRDTVGVPLEIRRTSLFPRSRIQKQILRAFPDEPVSNDRRLTILPTRPKLNQPKHSLTTK